MAQLMGEGDTSPLGVTLPLHHGFAGPVVFGADAGECGDATICLVLVYCQINITRKGQCKNIAIHMEIGMFKYSSLYMYDIRMQVLEVLVYDTVTKHLLNGVAYLKCGLLYMYKCHYKFRKLLYWFCINIMRVA